jgi:hypothetical protein
MRVSCRELILSEAQQTQGQCNAHSRAEQQAGSCAVVPGNLVLAGGSASPRFHGYPYSRSSRIGLQSYFPSPSHLPGVILGQSLAIEANLGQVQWSVMPGPLVFRRDPCRGVGGHRSNLVVAKLSRRRRRYSVLSIHPIAYIYLMSDYFAGISHVSVMALARPGISQPRRQYSGRSNILNALELAMMCSPRELDGSPIPLSSLLFSSLGRARGVKKKRKNKPRARYQLPRR